MRIVLAVLLATLLVVPPAGAATVQLNIEGPFPHSTGDSYSLSFAATAGEANDVTITSVPGGVLVRDAGAPLVAGPFCAATTSGVSCAAPGGALSLQAAVDLGDGDDRLAAEGFGADVQGGPGDDVITVERGTIDGGTGGDVMRITDPAKASEVTYATRTGGVSVTEDGVANDGEPGERDDVGFGIDAIRGGHGDDVLVAGQEPHILDGGDGNDRLVGGPRDDILNGAHGNDVLLGGGGDDNLLALEGADVIRGGPGKDSTGWGHAITGIHVTLDDRPDDGMPGENDDVGADVEVLTGTKYDDVMAGSDGPQVLDGREGDDRLDGARGNDVIAGDLGDHNVLTGGAGVDQITSAGRFDTIRARDGDRDAIGCHSPSVRQRFDVDRFDSVRFCATELRIAEGQRLRLDARGRVALVAHCPARSGDCDGSVRMTRCRAPKVTIGRAAVHVPEGRTRHLRVRLTRPARKVVRRHHLVCGIATIRTHRTRPPASAQEVNVSFRLLA